MDSLSNITTFVQVAETRSYAETGRVLGVSASAVGKAITRLEERLGVRLFHRSTRSMALTGEGSQFLERCRRILSEVEAAEAELSGASGAPRGRLRVSAPQLLALLMPVIDGFMQKYPEVEIDLDMSDHMADVIEDGFDAVIRTGTPNDSRLVARKLGRCRQVVVGAPAYFAQRGVPSHPDELRHHACLQHKFPATGRLERWPLTDGDIELDFAMPETFTVNTVEGLLYLAKKGRGIAFLPEFLVREALKAGDLRTVLDNYIERDVVFWMLWPASRHPSPKLRVFIDYMCAYLRI